ncbi:MAG: hypothetical protein V4858_12495 [Pseudomonadota bacterium]
MNLFELNKHMQTFALLAMVAEAIGLALVAWAMYWITKIAVRQGIRESGLIEALKHTRRGEEPTPNNLPDMRADR